ncbi:hypothetical protein QBC42DRAFT_170841 [Cladorrhinum samala]|uniref:Uncharacterized protein n=1 Tax=Cladorrhinum samala TaxID=585594 RepID=A0AAV9HYJ7_9PEZI|nr:hypothetical protein QBC42DRAFT_170841 [Cladorrhinum samala]
MRFSATLSMAMASFSASALAMPAEPAVRQDAVALPAKLVPESIANATALGVDVWGPIPADATTGDGYYKAEPGTPGWAWIRAQVDLAAYEKELQARGLSVPEGVEKRQATNIQLNFFTGDWCTGSAWHFPNLGYGVKAVPAENVYIYSVGFSGRTLRANEYLTLRRGDFNGDRCAEWHGTINGPTEPNLCWQIEATTCFRMNQSVN